MLFAQKSPVRDNWTSVKAIPAGAGIEVETKNGKTFEGKLDAVSDTVVTIAHNGKTDGVAMADVKKVFRTDGGSAGKSIAIWTAIGAGVGVGAGAAVLGATGGSDDTAKVLTPFVLVGAGIGAVIGAAIGRHRRSLIYQTK